MNRKIHPPRSIRPVTWRFPATQVCQEDASLPFACVLIPLVATKTLTTATSTTMTTEDEDVGTTTMEAVTATTTTTSLMASASSSLLLSPPALTAIDKCLHCGAPHPDHTTHVLLSSSSQSGAAATVARATGTKRSSSAGVLLCYLCGKTSAANSSTTPTTISSSSSSSSSSSAQRQIPNNPIHTFSLPLRLCTDLTHHYTSHNNAASLPSSSTTTAAAGPAPTATLYHVPAMTCPPLWFIVLDGGTLATTAFYKAVSVALQTVLATMPLHAHVSLLIANQRATTAAATPRRSLSSQNDGVVTDDEVEEEEEEPPCCLGVVDWQDNHNYSNNQHGTTATITSSVTAVHHYVSEEACCREEDLIHAVLRSLVPASELLGEQHRDRLEQALQAISHYQPYHYQKRKNRNVSNHHSSSNNKKDEWSKKNSSKSKQESDDDEEEEEATMVPPNEDNDDYNNNNNNSDRFRCPVGWTTEVILVALQTAAAPAGQRHAASSAFNSDQRGGRVDDDGNNDDSNDNDNNNADSEHGVALPFCLPYAGGKITYILADSGLAAMPTIQSTAAAPASGGGRVGLGGFGGRIHGLGRSDLGQRFYVATEADEEEEETIKNQPGERAAPSSNNRHGNSGKGSDDDGPVDVALTPTALAELYYRDESMLEDDLDAYFADLGKQCAEAALGVDILCLETTKNSKINNSKKNSPATATTTQFGLPFLQIVSLKSGAAGPVLFDLHDADSMSLFQAELLSRVPWHEGRVFGAELRVRVSPGFAVDVNAVDGGGTNTTGVKSSSRGGTAGGPELAPLYCEAGLSGSASPVEESTQLWRMGTCDPTTALTVDLTLTGSRVKDRIKVSAVGEVALKPVLQTCFAYTTIVQDDHGQYYTVRHMRIASYQAELAFDAEHLFDSTDPQALAVVLFHKLAIAVLQDGPEETTEVAHNWLQAALVSVYRSAEEQAAAISEREEKGIVGTDSSLPSFYPAERLLDREGDLHAEEVLLAQGHEHLRSLPHMIYELLQCDAFRPAGGAFQPTVDLRVAALMQMASMTPEALSRCMAPRLQLWPSRGGGGGGGHPQQHPYGGDGGGEEPVMDHIALNAAAVKQAVLDYDQAAEVTTPDNLILVLEAPEQTTLMDASCVKPNPLQHLRRYSLEPSPALLKAMTDAASVYRCKPPVFNLLQETDCDAILLRLSDILVEEPPSTTGQANFAEWRSMMAASVNEELLEEK